MHADIVLTEFFTEVLFIIDIPVKMCIILPEVAVKAFRHKDL